MMNHIASLISLVVFLAASTVGCSPAGNQSPLDDSRQMVLVVSRDWDAATATLQCYSRDAAGKAWTRVGEPIPANIGRTGLAWGRGLHTGTPLPGPVKREGDGKAPAGVFELPGAFGYADTVDPEDIKLYYVTLTADTFGVDDVKSKYYNQVVNLKDVTKDWNSAETMRRPDGLYEWGVFVNHNTTATVPGAGSCIFLHIWRGPNKPTAGCTSMSTENMQAIIAWLDPKAKPVLVQLPENEYRKLASVWGLPIAR